MSLTTKVIYGVGLFGGSLIVLEHVARVKQSSKKPSTAINFCAVKCKNGFTQAGNLIAKLSSFYTFVDFKEVIKTVQDLGGSFFNLCKSPLYTLKGYYDSAVTYDNPIIVVVGSCTLVGLLGYLSVINPKLVTDVYNKMIKSVESNHK